MNTRTLLRLCLAALLPASPAFMPVARAQYETVEIDRALTITKYTGDSGAIVIPAAINGLPVTRIGNGAFARRRSLTGITIPDTVTAIGDDAFDAMDSSSGLTNVTFGNGVTSIGNFAFSACDKLASVTLPDSVAAIGDGAFLFCERLTEVRLSRNVTHIGNRAFNGCFRLTSIIVDEHNPAYSSAGGVLFNKSQTVLLQYPGGKTGPYIVPATLASLGELALWNCPNLTGITLPDGLTRLNPEEFAACLRLETAIIPATVTNISDGAFDSCVRLKGIYFKGNAPRLGRHGLYGSGQETVYYLPATDGWGSIYGGRPTAPWKP